MSIKSIALAITVLILSASSNAAIIYQFDFTDMFLVDGGTEGDPLAEFSITLEYSDYMTTTGMLEVSGGPLPTSLGYPVIYAGTNSAGWWGFDGSVNQAYIFDNGFGFSSSSFVFTPNWREWSNGYFTAPGAYSGDIGGNAPTAFHGAAKLTIIETNAIPLPPSIWLLSSGLIGLITLAKGYKYN